MGKQFQPMHSPQMFGDPAPGKRKVLKIIYTSTQITEKSALGSLFNDVVDTVTSTKISDDFDCLLSSRVIAKVSTNDNVLIITYYQYFEPSKITNLKSYNMKRINTAKTKQIEIVCNNEKESEKLEKKISRYMQKM